MLEETAVRISRESDYVQYYIDAHNARKVWRNDFAAGEISQGGSIGFRYCG